MLKFVYLYNYMYILEYTCIVWYLTNYIALLSLSEARDPKRKDKIL